MAFLIVVIVMLQLLAVLLDTVRSQILQRCGPHLSELQDIHLRLQANINRVLFEAARWRTML